MQPLTSRAIAKGEEEDLSSLTFLSVFAILTKRVYGQGFFNPIDQRRLPAYLAFSQKGAFKV